MCSSDLAVLDTLVEEWSDRGIELKQVGSGYRFQVRQELSTWISRMNEERAPRYSRALLETLALVVYRQPITRAEIEDVRGVAVSTNIIKTLLEREWVRVVGHRDVPGKPALFGTTKGFLDYFNLKSLSELPPLAEIRDLDAVQKELELNIDNTEESENVVSIEGPSEDTEVNVEMIAAENIDNEEIVDIKEPELNVANPEISEDIVDIETPLEDTEVNIETTTAENIDNEEVVDKEELVEENNEEFDEYTADTDKLSA